MFVRATAWAWGPYIDKSGTTLRRPWEISGQPTSGTEHRESQFVLPPKITYETLHLSLHFGGITVTQLRPKGPPSMFLGIVLMVQIDL